MGHMSRACRGVRTRLGNRQYAEYEGVAWGAESGEVVTLIGSSSSQGLWAEARRVRVLTCCIRGGTPRHVGQVRTALELITHRLPATAGELVKRESTRQ